MIENNPTQIQSELVPQSDIEQNSLMEIMVGLFQKSKDKTQPTINPMINRMINPNGQWAYEPAPLQPSPSKQSDNPVDLI